MSDPRTPEAFFFPLRAIFAEQLGLAQDAITPASHCVNDLGCDSLDAVELVMEIEDAFDLSIPDEDIDGLTTIQVITEYLASHGAVLADHTVCAECGNVIVGSYVRAHDKRYHIGCSEDRPVKVTKATVVESDRTLTLVVQCLKDNTPDWRIVTHGEDLSGINALAIFDGVLCTDECGWCIALAQRVQSRTGYRPVAGPTTVLAAELEQLHVQLAGCSVIALGGTNPENVATPGDYGYSSAYQDVRNLRGYFDLAQTTLKKIATQACTCGERGKTADAQHAITGFCNPCRAEGALHVIAQKMEEAGQGTIPVFAEAAQD